MVLLHNVTCTTGIIFATKNFTADHMMVKNDCNNYCFVVFIIIILCVILLLLSTNVSMLLFHYVVEQTVEDSIVKSLTGSA